MVKGNILIYERKHYDLLNDIVPLRISNLKPI